MRPSLLAAILALPVGLVQGGCGHGRQSLVLVSVAGWPARAPGEVPPTPHLEALARRSHSRLGLPVASGELLAAEASLQTGAGPARHGIRGIRAGERLAAGVPTLAEALGRRGYRTRALRANRDLADLAGLERGFEPLPPPARSLDGLVEQAAAALEELSARGPFYLWLALDARDDAGGVARLAEVDGALGRILEAVARLDGRRPLVVVAGTMGLPREAPLLGPGAASVPALLPRAWGDPRCRGNSASVGSEVARSLGLAGFGCDAGGAPESWAPLARFGTDAPGPAAPGWAPLRELAPLDAGLGARLGELGLPGPLAEERLRREGPAPSEERLRAAMADQVLAAIRLRAGHRASARALYERALEADPLALEALLEVAREEAFSGGAARAAQRLRAALPAYRGRPEVYHTLAHVSLLLRAHPEALACAEATARFLPRDADVRLDMAVSQAALGRTEEALRSLGLAVELGFRDAALLDRIEALASLRTDPRFAGLVARMREKP